MREKRPLLKHQETALRHALKKGHPAFFLAMRLGKTLSAIRWISEASKRYAIRKHVLVVAPSWTMAGWRDELRAEGESYVLLQASKEKRLELVSETWGIPRRMWYLITYDALRVTPGLGDLDWLAVILDESTKIRNPQTQITRFCVEHFRTVPHRAIMSGMPAPEGPLDLFSQFKFLRGQFMGYSNYWKFRADLFAPDWTGHKHLPKKGVLERIKLTLQEEACCISKQDAGIENRAFYETATVDMPKELRYVYEEAQRSFEFDGNMTNWVMVMEMWLARLAGGFDTDGNLISNHKLKLLLELLREPLKDEPVVIWCRFTAEIEATVRMLNEAGMKTLTVTGKTPSKQKLELESRFRNGDADIIVGQVKCGKFGLELSRASTMIYYSNSYSCEDRQQSEERIKNMMKKEPLLYMDLVTNDTVDEDAVYALKYKGVDAKTLPVILKERFNARVRKI